VFLLSKVPSTDPSVRRGRSDGLKELRLFNFSHFGTASRTAPSSGDVDATRLLFISCRPFRSFESGCLRHKSRLNKMFWAAFYPQDVSEMNTNAHVMGLLFNRVNSGVFRARWIIYSFQVSKYPLIQLLRIIEMFVRVLFLHNSRFIQSLIHSPSIFFKARIS